VGKKNQKLNRTEPVYKSSEPNPRKLLENCDRRKF